MNADKDKCIPLPGFILPFPLTIIALVGLYIICKDKKENRHCRFYPNIICVLSVLETIAIVSIIIFAKQYGISPTFYLSLCGGTFLYGLNVFFTMIYFTQMKKDSAFKYWEEVYALKANIIVLVGCFVNFKVFRML